ncbi:hypothetical protein PRUPE_2G080400 [Prunus persica]|uniref:RRM domain-containing protein n=1 Tax=Prunus persica TaxID=3760 RepID=A0A251QCZ8_PRUPE|nr:hypothetical protein PRUPE_2G080400 [Prunus persica]
MNFAYGGTGVFDTVFGGPNLTTQIDFFQQLLEQKLYSTKNDVVNSSIALVSVAGNDYAAYFGNHTEVSGLLFYTFGKTLRAAFEGFGELVEVKIIMDKISKRSKGYAFIEYTTEEAASAALREMNGKIINGWMIVVDVAKTSPPRYSRGQSRPATR